MATLQPDLPSGVVGLSRSPFRVPIARRHNDVVTLGQPSRPRADHGRPRHCLAVMVGLSAIAAADPPMRAPHVIPAEPFIFTNTLGENPCVFPVLLAITTNKEILTTFTQRSGVTVIHTTGALKVRLTNTTTGTTIDRNISGPILATVNADGSTTQKGTGPALWVFDPGVAPALPASRYHLR